MSKRLASFNYEDVRYVVTLDGGYLENSFPGKNAVSINEIQVNPGYSAAVSQPWGAYRPNMCPVSEDASVVKVGDSFIVHGTCGGYCFELTEMSYEIEEEVPEEAHVTEETLEAAEEMSEQIDVDEEDAYVMQETLKAEAELSEDLPGQSSDPGVPFLVGEVATDEVANKMMDFVRNVPVTHNANTKQMSIGNPKHNGIRLHADVIDKRKESSTLIVDPVMRKPDSYRGVRLGLSLNATAEPIKVEHPRTEHAPSRYTPAYREPVHNQHKKTPTGYESRTEEEIPVVQTVPPSAVLNFDDAPKPNLNDFDCQEFLNGLSDEQIKFLRKVPECFLGTIHEFTKDPISIAKLESLGTIYCVDNKWKISGDWYAIDEIQTLSRCIYCATTNEYQRISTKTLKGWQKCVEAGVVG